MADNYINFQEISQQVPFKNLLDYLNVPYVVKNGELRGRGFVINVEKNLFFNPKGDGKGSVINFLAEFRKIDLRVAAQEISEVFLKKFQEPKKVIPNLELHRTPFLSNMGITDELADLYEIGLVKQKSIITGKIAFKMYDETGLHIGYVAYNPKDNSWFFPKGFKRPLWNYHNAIDNGSNSCICVSNLFEAMYLIKLGFNNTVCLVAYSMTDGQELLLKNFDSILLLHPDPYNIVFRLCRDVSIKAPLITKTINEYSGEEIVSFWHS
jgi:hypothetical protein